MSDNDRAESERTTQLSQLIGAVSFGAAIFAPTGVGISLALSGAGAGEVLGTSYGVAAATIVVGWLSEEVAIRGI